MTKEQLAQATPAELKAALAAAEKTRSKNRKAYKELVTESLPKALGKLINLSEEISDVKTGIFKDLSNILALKHEVYDVKPTQQSHTFSLENGEGITLGLRVTDGWDDTVNEGVAKVREFLNSLAKDQESAMLVAGINKLLKKDAKGNLKANRVIELKNLADDFNSDAFTDGVNIIQNAYRPQRSCYFIEANTVDAIGNKQNIPLSISAVGFSEDITVNISQL